jgi:hypothetical protein
MLMSALIRSEAWAFARSGKNNDLRAEKDAILSRACLAQEWIEVLRNPVIRTCTDFQRARAAAIARYRRR